MLLLLASLAHATATQIFADDDAVLAWIAVSDRTARTELPVVGPNTMRRFEDRAHGDVRFFHILPSDDPEAAAIDARLERGSPCALVLAHLGDGWVGWRSGVCGMLSTTGWRIEGDQVIDGRGRPILVSTFASASGDRDVYQAYRRLDRARGRALWAGILGSGVLFASTIDLLDGSRRPTSRFLQVGGGAMTIGAAIAFGVLQANPKSHPRQIGAHYTEEEMLARVRHHNRRLRIALGPTGLSGTFL